ncbi:putative F-box/LRR-repeat protein At5g38386 isoform X1 [Coffea arabica]|uniref:F-box/LRR-repeat protein At5g38386 isoform X1 n=1 Tax=Coffea arabica TaxID=13443 RepID=A0A6P6TSE6_COFAR|nr:putative F-box/LRR-repeat protein At5g38386 isoform X1 [Coffea arabica]XP_027081374.1 putative F-box/LRR-repeat protein At5g38386 isoform X1 [Coffea arabica]XP_027081375.1 putative F-box/LRR-repeat protein At5g38386 isoform X1 [Coffea arabica]
MCWFGNRALPFAILVAATGAAIQKAIKSFGGQGKAIVLQEKHEQDFVHKADDGLANEDSISRLPDDLLSDVLSRLDLIEAVGTRILSRRWKNVCKVRSELHLDCLDMFRPNCSHDMGSHWVQFRFLEAVDQSLQLYSGQSITYLRISCCFMKEFEPKFTQWMQVVATLDVQELDLKFICSSLPLCQCAKSNMGELFPVSFRLLTAVATMKHLRLLACSLQPSFPTQFNSLEGLYLDLVHLSDGELPRMLSSCVNLQTLRLGFCKLTPKLSISGPCLQLKFLYVHSCPGLEEIDICAGNLITFSFFHNGPIKFSLCVPKLEDARITFTGNGSIPYFFGEVLKDCPKLKNLLFQTHSDKLQYTPGKMDMFSNLRTLYFVPGMRSPPDLLNVVPILEACPHLEEFRLQLLCRGFNEERGREWPPRRLGQLKEVEFNGFHGTVNEIHFATYLVKNAPALERLWIRSPYRFYCDDYHLETGGGWYRDERVDTLHEELMMQAVSSKLQVNIVRSPRTELRICGRE